jgi:hypothetical protein
VFAASSTVAGLRYSCYSGGKDTSATIFVEGEGVSDLVTSTWGVGSNCNDISRSVGIDGNYSSTSGGRGCDCGPADVVESSGRSKSIQGGDASRRTSSQLISIQLKSVEAVTCQGAFPGHDARNFD